MASHRSDRDWTPSPFYLALWAIVSVSGAILCTTVRCVSSSVQLHSWCNCEGYLSWSGSPSHWRVRLTIGCLELLLVSCLTVQGSLVYGLTRQSLYTLSLVDSLMC